MSRHWSWSVLAALSISSAQAQTALIKQPEVVLKNFDIATLGPVLTDLGVQWRRAVSKGEPYIAAKYKDLDFMITPEACLGEAGHVTARLDTKDRFKGRVS